MNITDYSNRIRVERARFGFTQKDLAAALGVSEPTVVKWEKDIRTLTIEKAIEISNIFGGVSLDYIVGLTDERAKAIR